MARDTTLEIGYVGNHAIHQTTSYDINGPLPSQWLNATFSDTNNLGSNGFRPYKFNNSLTWWTHQGDATYHSLQTLFKTRYKRSQFTGAYTWSHSIGNFQLDDSSGGFGGSTFTWYQDPRLDRGNTAINRPHIFVANFNYYLPDLNGASKMVHGAFGGWELGMISTVASGNSFTVYQNGISDDTSLMPAGAATHVNSLFESGYINNERPLLVPGQSCGIRNGDTLVNQSAFTLIGYQLGTIMPGTEPRGYCHGPSLVDQDLSIDKNFKLTERVRMQFRIDLFNMLNRANFRADQINSGQPFSHVNCGPTDASGLYQPCSPTNNVVTHQTLATGTYGQATSVVGNAGREVQYGLHITF